MDDLLSEFLTESSENIASLDQDLIILETNPHNPALMSRIFRAMHTIKGTCGFIGLPRLEKLAHAGENILGRIREGEISVSPAIVTLILKCLDQIRWILKELEEKGTEPLEDNEELINTINTTIQNSLSKSTETIEVPVWTSSDMSVSPVSLPTVENFSHRESVDLLNTPKTIRVNVDLLENLMMMVSELVLTRNQLLQMTPETEAAFFAQSLQRLNNVTSELQDGVIKTRMQPIGNAWSKLPRFVRDLNLELHKKIDLELMGADTELDRQVLELIKDPLMHMVRNSADHGIEFPSERKARGKPETGKISLLAYHQGGHIIVEVKDNGKGIHLEQIKKNILNKKLASEHEISTFTSSQIMKFIFIPGFSTAQEVTHISGRGVGMDVVKNNIEKIGGTIELRSVEGEGTTFTIKIPLTLAIISGLVVEVVQKKFVIPQICIVELVGISYRTTNHIQTILGVPFLKLREQLLPLCYLDEILKLREPRNFHSDIDLKDYYVVIMQVGTHTFGIIVEQVFETQEIVVKPIAKILRHIPIYSGNTILGDGQIVMILDPNGLSNRIIKETLEEKFIENKVATANDFEENKISFLIFKAGNGITKAIPLTLILRLEEFETSQIGQSEGKYVIQYRDKLMPLIHIDEHSKSFTSHKQPVLVFSDRNQFVGFIIDEIVDIVQEKFDIKMKTDSPSLLGSTIIGGHTTEILNVDYYIQKACPEWFVEDAFEETSYEKATQTILLIDDSVFFRNLMIPLISAQGHQVKTVDTAEKALELYEQNRNFDVILCDIELPRMNGFDFAKKVKALERWKDIPLIAVSSHYFEEESEKVQNSGFEGFISKNDCLGINKILESIFDKIRNKTL